MKPEELRKGNLIVFHDGSNQVVEVQHLSFSSSMWFVYWKLVKWQKGGFKTGNSILKDFKPLKLTPELLKSYGFDIAYRTHDTGNYDAWADMGSVHVIFNKGKSFVRHRGFNMTTIMEHIKYFHQLQNFYYLWENKELKYESKQSKKS